jgi:hypothetical protein
MLKMQRPSRFIVENGLSPGRKEPGATKLARWSSLMESRTEVLEPLLLARQTVDGTSSRL